MENEMVDIKNSGTVIFRFESIVLCFFSVLGVISSFALLISEINYISNPDQNLACDLNPLVGCSNSILSWQAHLFFGVPNSVVGLVVFSALSTVFVLSAFKVQFPTWCWNVILLGKTLALLWVFWFLGVSVLSFKKLCPFCLLLWVSVIFIWSTVLGINARNRFVFSSLPKLGDGLAINRYYIAVVIILLMCVCIVFTMMDALMLVFS